MKIAFVLFFAAVAMTSAGATTLDPAQPQLGQRATLSLDAAPTDSTQWPTGSNVVLRATADPKVFEVIAIRVGEAAIALPATADTLRWEVEPRLAQATPDSLRPIERVGAIGPDFRPHAVVVALLVAALLAWWWRRRGRTPVRSAFDLPLQPPHEIALRRLDEIRRAGWIARGEFDRVYVEASHALRDYVGGRYRVPALDWTTSETIDRLLDAGYEREDVAGIDPLLRAADEVKFAARRPSEHQAESWIDDARTWIERTAVPVVFSTPDAIRAAEELHGGKST